MNDSQQRADFWWLLLPLCMVLPMLGCKASPPGGSPIEPAPLGSIVDEVNRTQESNAEAAKFIVYVHEFELNEPLRQSIRTWVDGVDENGEQDQVRKTVESLHRRGYRLNEYGVEHLQMIARAIHNGAVERVIVERSQTSKRQRTLHQFPVHFNSKLDQARRDIVVAALSTLGVSDANDIVVVAPAFPEGLHSDEAIQAYQQNRFGNSMGNYGGGGGGFLGGF